MNSLGSRCLDSFGIQVSVFCLVNRCMVSFGNRCPYLLGNCVLGIQGSGKQMSEFKMIEKHLSRNRVVLVPTLRCLINGYTRLSTMDSN